MRKILWNLLLVSVVLSMLLSACAPASTPTQAPTAPTTAPKEGTKSIVRVGTGDSGEGLNPHQQIIGQFEEANKDVLVQLEPAC